MPATETYGAQPPIELLRLFIDMKGLYDRDEWQWKDVEDTTLVASAAPPGGGRSPITLRFTRHFNMFCVPNADKTTLTKIFSSILQGFLKTGF
jgi:dynein heavy chain